MKIIINGRFLLHRVTGVERYAREILSELDKLIYPGEVELALPPETLEIPNYKNIIITQVGKLKDKLWEHISFPAYVRRERAVSLNLCNAAPFSTPGIVCIHDVKIKAHPEYFNRKFLLYYNLLFLNSIKRAQRIITVSEFSKKEIIKYYNISADKIVIISNAWQHYERIEYDEGTLEKYNLEKNNYFFALGSMEPNKNFKWIAETAKNMPDQLFAIAGSINEKVFADGLGFKRPSNVKLLGYIEDKEAKTLMRDCKAFLFPSIYEGFGIPPLEAMSAGCKNIAVSDTEVMHEIFGNAVTYLNTKIPVNKLDFENSGQEKILKKYSWMESAKRIYSLIKEF